MTPSALLNELLGQIYDCAIYAERWPDTLEKLASVVSGSSVALTLNSMRNPGFQMHASWGLDPDFEAAMLANYAINPLVPMIWYLGEEEVFSVFGVLQPDEVENSLFFERTHKKFGVGDSAIGVLAKSISHFGSISIQRSSDQQPFTPGDVEILQSLTPHLRRAVMISDMLHERALERNRMQSLLNLLSVGVLLADSDGRILHTNSRAQQFLEDGRILRSGDGFVGGTGSRNAAALRAAILRAASGIAAELAMSAGETVISSAGVPDLAVWILPLGPVNCSSGDIPSRQPRAAFSC